MESIHLYTDASAGQCGSSVGGFSVVTDTEILFMGMEFTKTTSTRLEGLAVCTALYLASTDYLDQKVIIHTDSHLWATRYASLPYLHDNDWRSKCGKRAKDIPILKMMWNYYDVDRVSVEWVKGHSDTPGNIFADQVAKEAYHLAERLRCGKMGL